MRRAWDGTREEAHGGADLESAGEIEVVVANGRATAAACSESRIFASMDFNLHAQRTLSPGSC